MRNLISRFFALVAILSLQQCTFIPASYKHQQFWDSFSERRYPAENMKLVEKKGVEDESLSYFADEQNSEIPQGSSGEFINYYDIAEEITSKLQTFKSVEMPEDLAKKSQNTDIKLDLASIPQSPFSAMKVKNIDENIKILSGFSA